MTSTSCLIAGPTDKTKLFRYGGILEREYRGFVDGIGIVLARHIARVDFVLDKGVPFDVSAAYKRAGGNNCIGYLPAGELQSYTSKQHCDDIREIEGGWTLLNTCLSLKSEGIVCFGLSAGTLVEIAYSKYHAKYLGKSTVVLIDDRTMSQRLPKELEEDIDVRYFDSNQTLEQLLIKGFS